MKEIVGKEFDDLLQDSEKPVVVDFFAGWCGPCNMLAPIFKEVSEELEEKAEFVKFDTEKDPQGASKNSVMGLPTIVVFKNGSEVDRIVGFREKAQLKQEILDLVE